MSLERAYLAPSLSIRKETSLVLGKAPSRMVVQGCSCLDLEVLPAEDDRRYSPLSTEEHFIQTQSLGF